MCAKLGGDLNQQLVGAQVRVGNVRHPVALIQAGDEFAAQHGFAGANFAGDFDKALAVGHGRQQLVQGQVRGL